MYVSSDRSFSEYRDRGIMEVTCVKIILTFQHFEITFRRKGGRGRGGEKKKGQSEERGGKKNVTGEPRIDPLWRNVECNVT